MGGGGGGESDRQKHLDKAVKRDIVMQHLIQLLIKRILYARR